MKSLIIVLSGLILSVICQGQTAIEYFNRGVDKYDLGDYRGAIADFNKAIEINPKYAEAYYNRGSAKGELADFKRAIADYSKVIEINPKDAEAYYYRGFAKYLIEDKNGSCLDWKKASELGSIKADESIKKYCK
jgi:tetratricopeptide (TPR) repeat protein